MLSLESLFKEFIYCLEYEKKKNLNSIKSFKSDLKQFGEFLSTREELKEIEDITKLTIRSFINWIHKKNVSKRSSNRKLSTLRSFFKYLIDEDKIEKNPALLVDFPNYEIEVPDTLSFEEINSIRDSISSLTLNDRRDKLIFELLYSTGITSQELLSLGEGVFNLEMRELKVINERTSRTVFFSKRTKDSFEKYIKIKKEKYKEKYNKDILFINSSGTRLSDRSLRRIIDKYIQKTEIKKDITPYTFRHTFAIHMLKKGMDIHYLKELMGHSSIEVTKNYEIMIKTVLK
ncbi:MAG: tyrosine-type recombinase/integrase [Fusobacteriaceae bacterium]